MTASKRQIGNVSFPNLEEVTDPMDISGQKNEHQNHMKFVTEYSTQSRVNTNQNQSRIYAV